MNLILGLVWLVLGVALLVDVRLTSEGLLLMARHEGSFVLPALMFFLALYNVIRWRFSRTNSDQRRLRADRVRRRQSDANAPAPVRVLDSNFDFSDRPPQ